MLSPSRPDSSGDIALQTLLKTGLFAFGGVGYARIISPGENAFRTILARKTALADFESAFVNGNIQAKCYAMVGIRKLSARHYDELAKLYTRSTQSVTIMQGCIMQQLPASEIVRRITSGHYQ